MLYTPPTGSTGPNDPFVGKNVAAGTQGSKVPPGAVMNPQKEIQNAIAGTGQSPTNSDLTQLIQAISSGIDLGTIGGTANALVDTLPGSVAIPQLRTGMTFFGVIGPNPNTGSATLEIDGFTSSPGPKPIVRRDGTTALVAGDLQAGELRAFRFDGTSFRVVGTVPSEYTPGGTTPTSPAPLSALPFRGYKVLVPGDTQWTFPAGVYACWVRGWGAGGGSGGVAATGAASSGAGSGGFFEGPYHFSNTELTNGYVACSVGAKGAAGGGGSAGGNGGATTFGTWAAFGGTGSAGVSSGISYATFVGGQGLNAPTIFSGSSGSPGFKDYNATVFGGLGSPAPGAGGLAPAGSQGSYPGGGAAGVASQSGAIAGQPGGDGRILILY